MKQKYEYKILDIQKPYKNYGKKEEIINIHALQGYELICTSVVPMGISDDIRNGKTLGKKVWCIEHLYLRREIEQKGEE